MSAQQAQQPHACAPCMQGAVLAMGKARKRSRLSRHCTGYPYNPVRVSAAHADNNSLRGHDMSGLFAVSPLFSQQLENQSKALGPVQRHAELRRLEFVRAYTGYAVHKTYSLASSVYGTGRSLAPTRLDGKVRAVEDKLLGLTTPVVEAVQGVGDRVLVNLDAGVDAAMVTTHNLWHPKHQLQRSDSGNHFMPLTEQRRAHLFSIQQSLEYLREHGLVGAARAAADVLLQRVEEAQQLPAKIGSEAEVLVARVTDAWHKLLSLPPVSKAIEAAEPGVEFTRSKYLAAHNAVVASPTYGKAMGIAEGMVKRVQDNFFYRTAAHRLYPVIADYADPALDKLVHSPYYSAVVDHLKPAPEAAMLHKALCV